MNARNLLPCILATAALLAGCSKDTATAGKTAPGTPATPGQFTDAQFIETFGWYVGARNGIDSFGFTEAETEIMIKGLRAAAAAKDAPYNLDVIGMQLDEFLGRRQQAYLARLREKNTAEGTAFFAKLKDNRNVTESQTGLRYEILQQGTGPAPKEMDTVRVHYEGKLLNGDIFDSSVARGEPAQFQLRPGGLIPAWIEGLQKVNTGGKIRLYVPADLGYGQNGNGTIPPASTLLFDVELLEINPVASPLPAMPPSDPAVK